MLSCSAWIYEEIFSLLDIKIIWDAQVKSFDEIDDKVHIHFADSTNHETDIVDLLIGADGIHSPIRKQLTGDSIRTWSY
jgi:2-polyprenyl-6-methoxyphenol hydroxylase-like FAD-dependent oxidoreductase